MDPLFEDQKLGTALDLLIKTILKQRYSEGRFEEEAKSIGIGGGTETLASVMNTEGPLHLTDRGCLAIHYGLL